MDPANKLKEPDKRQADLTIEELRTYPGLTDLTDEQAAHIISSLKELSLLLYYYACRKQRRVYSNDNQSIIRKLGYNKAA
jgi:hypothetical protein